MKKMIIFPSAILFLSITLHAQQKNDGYQLSGFANEKDSVEVLMKNKAAHFIQFGITSHNHEDFKQKYGVDIVYQNCVISPFISKLAKNNNKIIATYLTEKYGETWKKDLEVIPYGL